MPKVTAFRAQLVGNSTLLLDWDTSVNVKNKEYCDRSRRFSVKLFTYDSFDNYNRNRTSFISPDYISTAKRRDTNFTVTLNSTYSLNKFYIFRVRNQVIRGVITSGSLRVYKTNTYDSEVFYFGPRGKAMTDKGSMGV